MIPFEFLSSMVFSTEYTQSGNGRFSGVHSIVMEKSALAGEVRGACPSSFTLFSITYKVAVYAPAERADPLSVFHIYPYMFSVVLCFFYAEV